MSWYRRSTAPGLRNARRRSSIGASIRRSSVIAASSRVRSSSKGYIGRDLGNEDIELYIPSLEDMPLVAGYENVTFEPYIVPPVPLITTDEDDPTDEAGDLKPFTELPRLSKSEIRTILIQYADSKCINDKYAARDMVITNVEYKPGYKYTLETFTEMRQVCWSFEPYTGSPLDEVDVTQPPPGPWEMECAIPKAFHSHSLILDVPHTDLLMTCPGCGGIGSKRCNACSAAGWERCSLCLGDGRKTSIQGSRERCFRCLGTGRKKCWKCGGETIAVCIGCGGTGQIRCFIALTITWSNHVDSDILEPTVALPINHKLEFINGHLIFQDEKPLISSVTFPVKDLQSIATAVLEKHRNVTGVEKILLQRHGVWAIPVNYVTYQFKQKQKKFLVYGKKNEVYAPDFPESLCCCCVIS